MTFICSGSNKVHGIIRHITLYPDIHFTAVGIVDHIAVILGTGGRIHAVNIQVGLAQTAANQTVEHRAAGGAPQSKPVNQFLLRSFRNDRPVQLGGCLEHPGAAAVVGETDQRVKPLLVQFQIVLLGVGEHIALISFQMVSQQNLCFFLCNAVFSIVVQHISGAAGAITNGVLGIIRVRILSESFILFYHFDAFVTNSQSRLLGNGFSNVFFRFGRHISGAANQKTGQQSSGQQQAEHTFHGPYKLLPIIISRSL